MQLLPPCCLMTMSSLIQRSEASRQAAAGQFTEPADEKIGGVCNEEADRGEHRQVQVIH
jgi:hypothetical protein